MIYNSLNNTDIAISEFGFGASPFGNIYTKPISNNEAHQCIKLAIDNGINYFDVAPYYGQGIAEQKLAKALGKQTKNIILSTKIGRYGKQDFDFSAEKIKQSIHNSLQLFSRDYLDMVFCHDIEFIDSKTILTIALPTLAKLKEKGLVKAIGISGYPLDILYNIAQQFPFDIILTYSQYTLINQTLKSYEKKFQKLGIDIINASPFDMGLLTNSNCPTWHPAPKTIKNKVKNLLNECHKKAISLEKLAFQYSLSYKFPLSHLTGIGSITDLQQCLKWYQSSLNTHNLNTIKELLHNNEIMTRK